VAAPAAAAPDDRLPAAAPGAAAPAGGGGGARDGSGLVAAALARRLGGAASPSAPPGATESPFAARVVAKRAYARTPRGTTGTSATAKGERRAQSAGARGAMRHGAAGVVHATGIIAAQERPEREREPPLAGWRAVGCAGAAHGVRKEARAAMASSARAAQAGPARFCADASTQRASDPISMQGCGQLGAAVRAPGRRCCVVRPPRAKRCSAGQPPRACAEREAPTPQPLPLRRRDALAVALAAAATAAGACRAEQSGAVSSACAPPDAGATGGGASYDAYAESYDTLNDGAVADAFGAPRPRG
jgi:hypothetical protein